MSIKNRKCEIENSSGVETKRLSFLEIQTVKEFSLVRTKENSVLEKS